MAEIAWTGPLINDFLGLISDLACVDSMFVVNVSLVLSSISLFSMPFLDDITSFSVISALFGLFIAAYIALTSIVLVDFCGIENLTSAFGLLVVFRYPVVENIHKKC